VKIGYLCSDGDVQLYGHEGCSVHIREFTNALIENGHDVFIVCAWAGKRSRVETRARVYELQPTGLDAAVWASLQVEPVVQNHHLERDLRSILWNYWLLTGGFEIFEQERPDFLYERYGLFGWAGRELSRRLDLPWIVELNAPLCQQQAGYEKFVLTLTAERLERDLLALADAVIALTGWLKEWAVARGAAVDRIHVVPDGASRRLFGPAVSGDAVRARLGLSGMQVVGFVGSFHWWHDVGGLLDAFGRLLPSHPDLRLLLVGDGAERAPLAAKVERLGLGAAVVFAGRIPHQEVPEHLAAMDVAVVPYRKTDDFFFSPMKLFESMASGRPTIATDLGQIREIVKHGSTGWLYPAGDAALLAESIQTLLADGALAQRMGDAARREVLDRYTWEAVTAQVVEIARGLSRDRR
jgi:glycosyltransferase involved in cell wall biosynthesis